jgi:hypothetical protein
MKRNFCNLKTVKKSNVIHNYGLKDINSDVKFPRKKLKSTDRVYLFFASSCTSCTRKASGSKLGYAASNTEITCAVSEPL